MSQTKNTDNSPKTNSDEIARSIIQPIVDQAAGDSKGGGTKPPLHHNNHNNHNVQKSDKSDTKNKPSKSSKIDNNLQDEQYNNNNKKSSSNRNIVFHPDHPEKMDFDFSSTSTAHSQSPQTNKDTTNTTHNTHDNTPPDRNTPTDDRKENSSHTNTNMNPHNNSKSTHKENATRNGSTKNNTHDTSSHSNSKSSHHKSSKKEQMDKVAHKSASSSSLKSLTANLSREQRRERRRKLEDPNCFPKRFEVQVQARVRVGMDLSSQHLTDLPEGSVVTVEEIMNRRARISRPLCGWLSVTSKFGARIILPTNSKYSKIGGKVMFKRPIQGQQVLSTGQYPNQAKVVDYNDENSLYKVSYEDGNTQWIDIGDVNVQFISQHKAVKVQKPLDGTAPTFTLQTSQAFFNQFFCKDYPQYQAQSSSTTRHMDISPVSITGPNRFRYPPHNNTPPGPHGHPHGPPPPQGYPRGGPHVPPGPDGHHGAPNNPNAQLYPPSRSRTHPRGPHPHPHPHPHAPPGPYPPPGHPHAHSRGPPPPNNMYGPPGHPGNGSGHPPPPGPHGPYGRGPIPHPRGHPPPHGPYGPHPPPGPPYGPGPGPPPPHATHPRIDDSHHPTRRPPPNVNGPSNVSNGSKSKNDKNKEDTTTSKSTNEEFVNKVKEIERRIIQHLHQRGYDESHPDYHRYLQKAKELAIQKAGKEREKMLQQQRQREAAASQNKGVTRQEYEQYMRYRQEKQRQHAIAEQQRKQRIAEQQQAQRAKQQQVKPPPQTQTQPTTTSTSAVTPSTSPGNESSGKLTSPSKSSGSVKGLIVLRGLPGSGKTTLAKKLAQRSKNARICTEDRYHWSGKEDGVGEYKFQPQLVFLAREWCTKEIRECIQGNVNLIILDNHNARISMYEDHIQYAVEHGYRFRIIEFVATASLIDKYRARSYKKFPREVYVKLLKLWEHDPRTELINPTFGDNMKHQGQSKAQQQGQVQGNKNMEESSEDKNKSKNKSGGDGDGEVENNNNNEDKLASNDNVEQEQNKNNNLIDYSRRPLDQGLNISNKLNNNDSQ